MYFWQDIMSPPLPTVRSLIDEIRSLPNLDELEGIYHIGWEEGAHEIFGYLNTPNGAEVLAEELNKLSAELGRDIPFILITAAANRDWPKEWDHNDPKYRLLKVIYYPTYFFQRTQFRIGPAIEEFWPEKWNEHIVENYHHNKRMTGLDLSDLNTGLDITNFKYTYLYMVLFPKWHRAIMMDTLAKYDLHQHGALSWMEYNRNLDRSKILPGQLDSELEGDFRWQYWKNPRRLYLDQVNETPGPIFWDWLPEEYGQSFMQIVGESVPHCTLISEKTVVPILHNKPFLTVSCKGFHRYLEELGFKLYTEIFDYSFDDMEKVSDRCEGIAQNVIKVHNMLGTEGHAAVMAKIKDKLRYNKDLGHRLTQDPDYLPKEVINFLNCNNLVAQKSIDENRKNLEKYYPYFEYSKRFYNHHLKR